jgi:surface protein
MKTLNEFIIEKLILKRKSDKVFYPESFDDLVSEIVNRLINMENSNGTHLDLSNFDCSELKSLRDLFRKSSRKIHDKPFSLVYNKVKTLDVSNWDVSTIEDFTFLFHGLYNTTEIIGLNTWNMSSCKLMNSMFSNCRELKKIDLSNWDLKFNKLERYYFDGVFSNCTNLEEIKGLETWDMSNVISLNNVFLNCNKLKDLSNISNWDVSNVRDFISLFCYCYKLNKLDLSKWKPYIIDNIASMFKDCINLEEIKGLETWNLEHCLSLVSTFENCNKLKIDLSNCKLYHDVVKTNAFKKVNTKIFKKPNTKQ